MSFPDREEFDELRQTQALPPADPAEGFRLSFSPCRQGEEATESDFLSSLQDRLWACFVDSDSVTIQDFYGRLHRAVVDDIRSHETRPTAVDGIAGPTEIETEDPGSDSESDRDTDDLDNAPGFSQDAPPHGADGAAIGTDDTSESGSLATPSQGTDGPLALD